MLTIKRLFLLFFVVAVMAIPSVAWWYWPTRLPHPDECDRDQLFRWIALRDIGGETIETQRALVRRFQELILSDPSSVSVAIDSAYQRQVDRNRSRLQDLWFHDCVDAYQQLELKHRPEFLDRQLTTAVNWQSFKQGDPSVEGNSGSSPISRAVTHWIETARNAAEQEQMVAVLGAATVRWLSTNEVESLSVTARRTFATELFNELQRESVARVMAESATVDAESTESDRLLRNGELLLEAWFYEQARLYQAMGNEEDRRLFVKDKVLTVRESPLLSMLTTNGNARSSPLVQVLRIQQMIQAWIRRADASDRHMLQEFSTAVFREVMAGFTQASLDHLDSAWMSLHGDAPIMMQCG